MASDRKGAHGLADRYATALFELADAAGRLDAVADDLKRLDAMVRESADLERLVRSPVLTRQDQIRAMTAILHKAGMDDLTQRFIGLVAQNRRLFALTAMIAAYGRMVAARRGELTAQVTSASPLGERHLGRLTAALRAGLDSAVAVETRVDPGLLGGLVVRVGSRMVDSSLRTKLQRMRLVMKGVG